jgi:hypothetical protein
VHPLSHLAVFVAVLTILSACSSASTAMLDTARAALRGGSAAENVQLNPNFQYLRMTIGKRAAYVALGYTVQHPNGPIQVWYSGDLEVLRIQNGRIIGAIGVATEWRDVSISAPTWTTAKTASEPLRVVRTKDVMPGYRFGARDDLALRPIPAPSGSSLQNEDPLALSWFEERMIGSTLETRLPAARYAVDFRGGRESVVYAEQCLSLELCFTWQRWNVPKPPQKIAERGER